jgi:hypothetical protein
MILIVVVGIAASVTEAQRRGGGQQQGMPRYNPSTETTITGQVEKVEDRAQQGQGVRRLGGTHILVADQEIHIGPTGFLSENNWSFSVNDQVQVTGSEVQVDGSPVILAREVKRGDDVLTLRNERGIPLWSGGRRR